MDSTLTLPPLITSFSWLLEHWVPIIATPSFIGAIILIYRRGAIGLGNARWEADKCLKREKENEAAWIADRKRSDEREAYLTERVESLQKALGELDSLVDYLQNRQIAQAKSLIYQNKDTTPAPTNSPEELTLPANPPTSSTEKQ